MVYICLNFIPFLLQVFEYGKKKDSTGIYVCNALSIFVSLLTLILECIVWKTAGSFKRYIQKSIFNLFDIPICFFQIAYSIHRITDPFGEVFPEEFHDDLAPKFAIDHIMALTLSNMILTFFHLT